MGETGQQAAATADPSASSTSQRRPDPSAPAFPARIVCLTEETTETLYLLGEGDRVVGVSGYTMRPLEARRKPRISAFTSARFDKILELQPDLVLAFSDLQADLASELIRRGVQVFTFNQRTIAEILQMVRVVGGMVGAAARGEQLAGELAGHLDAIRVSAARFPHRPTVFFEEWDEPLIGGIAWVDELVEAAGGRSVVPELRDGSLARSRILNPARVAALRPEVVLASWCGKAVNRQRIRERRGWDDVPAVARDQVFEIESTYILQPGPAALTEGVRQMHAILCRVVGLPVPAALEPEHSPFKQR